MTAPQFLIESNSLGCSAIMAALVAKPPIELNALVDRVKPHHDHWLNSSGFERSNLKATLLRHHPWLNDSADCAVNCIL